MTGKQPETTPQTHVTLEVGSKPLPYTKICGHPTLREVTRWSGSSFTFCLTPCSSLITGRREFGFGFPCRKFCCAKTRGPRLFCIFINKKVLGWKPTFSCRVGCQIGATGKIVILEVRMTGPVPTYVRPIVANSLVLTPSRVLFDPLARSQQKNAGRGHSISYVIVQKSCKNSKLVKKIL